MIRADVGENFPISVALFDECAGELASGLTVYYEIKDANTDASLVPPISGTMVESTTEAGVYKVVESIPVGGEFLFYATCSGFMPNTEDIVVNPESLYDLTKALNVSVEDVPRTNATPTASQVVRNVPLGKTDYIVHRLKRTSDPDWTTTTASGIIYAWYRSTDDDLPYKMAGDGV
jgi:hypothetical protein